MAILKNLFGRPQHDTMPVLIGELKLKSNIIHGIYKTVNGTYYYKTSSGNMYLSKDYLSFDIVALELKDYTLYENYKN